MFSLGQRFRYLILTVLSYSTVAWCGSGSAESRFPGFSAGDYGYGFVAGRPFAGKYQKWLGWKKAMSYDIGYDPGSTVLSGGANFIYYKLTEDDRWKRQSYVGTILYGFVVGGIAGLPLGKEDEKTQIGVRAGLNFEYLVPNSSWSLRVELLPILFISGRESAGVQGGIGFTYYLNSKGEPALFSKISKRGTEDDSEGFSEDFEDEDLNESVNKRKPKKSVKARVKKKSPRKNVSKKRPKKRKKPRVTKRKKQKEKKPEKKSALDMLELED